MAGVGSRERSKRPRLGAGASWLALVAATALGGQLETVDTRISSERPLTHDAGGYRLVVHSYARAEVAPDGTPLPGARPLGSHQRSVTPAELEQGIAVRLLQLDAGERARDAMVLAWVEPGAPDLEFDALRARPSVDAWQGDSASRGTLRVSIGG